MIQKYQAIYIKYSAWKTSFINAAFLSWEYTIRFIIDRQR